MEESISLDCALALDRLVSRKPHVASDPHIAWILRQDRKEESDILAAVQKLLLRPDLTIAVAGCFRPRLMGIVDSLVQSLRHLCQVQTTVPVKETVIEPVDRHEAFYFSLDGLLEWSLSTHEYAVIALSRLLELAPHTLRIVLDYYSFAPEPFERLLHHTFAQAEDAPPLLDVVRACYRYLSLEPNKFRALWDWSSFIDLLRWNGLADPGKSQRESELDVRWCAVHILSVVYKFSDATTRAMSTKTSQITEKEYFDCLLRWEDLSNETSLEMAGMYFECTLEDEFMNSVETSEAVPTEWSATLGKLKERVKRATGKETSFIEVCGIELPIKTGTDVLISRSFVPTTTAVRNFESIVLALSQRHPILLEGPIGAGKSSLIRELANLTGNTDIIFTHLDDQMDSKTLLGTYVSTEIPGEFKWQPGPLTQAVAQGMWVVFEDIDKAPMEILSTLVPLLEDRKLYIAGRGETIIAADNFCIFATITQTKLGSAPRALGGKNMLSNLWRKVVVDAPSDEELAFILKARFPTLSELVDKLIGTLNAVTVVTSQSCGQENHPGISTIQVARLYSTRDLIKWCKRITDLGENHFRGPSLSTYVQERILMEAVDCLARSISVVADRRIVETVIAEQLTMPLEYIDSCRVRKPSLQVLTSKLQVGRATIQRSKNQDKCQPSQVFAPTGHFMRMLESVAVCVQHNEPVLLVGETGTGKTSLVQHLAKQVSVPLVVLNLSQQSDTVDLLGGYKPVDAQGVCIPLFEAYSALFRGTFSTKENPKILELLGRLLRKKKWDKLLKDLRLQVDSAAKFFPKGYLSGERYDKAIEDPPAKRHRLFSNSTLEAWRAFQSDLCRAERQVESAKTAFAFSFVEGALVKALKAGHWVLLDEVNLAPVETLERLTSVLEGEEGTLCLTERGDVENIKWHPHFRIFACMNPATDVGKRLLPTALRNRFSEFYVDELTNQEDLQSLVYRYLEAAIPCPPVEDIVEFYLRARREADLRLLDGATQKPHYSLRSLVRALEYTKAAMSTYGFQRSLYDGICMSFLTLLDRPSALVMEQLILEVLFKQKGKVASQFLKSILKAPPQPGPRHVLFEQFWVESGDFQPTASTLENSERYVMTTTIREHLKNLARAVFLRKNPVLLQGPTSSGKTSMIEYLASRTGHRFVRINNHEHTDLQEYLGSYVTDKFGKLTYQEGILVQAVRSGHWIVLDELNLAPSDVLEALNRLLDDNRELFVPELQMMIKPHPHFMLFATQNPPGVYGGRKALSRAFRNRFIELHVDDIPDHELQLILEKRCRIPGSYASQMVEVMKDLQRHRQGSKIFAGKHGFITPRDLFRWAERHSNGYEELAMDGYMLLAERLRSSEEKAVVQNILEKHMRVKMYPEKLHEALSPQRVEEIQDCLSASSFGKIVWTKSMTRIFNLVEHCIQHNEPVLLVGDTGCGKTTVCQLLATLLHRKLHILNCHQHSEAADFIGGFRPVRDRGNLTTKFAEGMRDLISSGLFSEDISEELSFRIEDAGLTLNVIQAALSKLQDQRRKSSMRSVGHGSSTELDDAERIVNEVLDLHREYQSLFVWQDGPLVSAMRDGDFFLVDEISLADDSVLERLNSILDPSRILVLAEKGGMQVEELKANSEFRLLATMNPGGDFGKRELSPALRNRFTEIWVPAISDLNDLQRIVAERLGSPELLSLKDPLLQFWQWFQRQGDQGRSLSVRDLLSWVMFINITWRDVGLTTALVHGACLVFFDGIGLGMGLSSTATLHLRKRCLDHLLELLPENERKVCQAAVSAESRLVKPSDAVAEELAASMVSHMEQRNLALQTDRFGIHPFYIARGKVAVTKAAFEMAAPTTSWNALRVLRALQLSKPVLVEGSPGVGKTSLISAIALSSGHRLVRINLSEQTEVVDLFGSDMPVDGGKAGDFQWSDGAFLQALKSGDWILLDELNLASQSVLEGLNACLDHRGEVYIPELGKTFKCPNTFRVFACQNPISQGGGRKGLPKSFLNRFTKVYVDTLGEDDLMFISEALHPSISKSLLREMVRFNSRLHEDIMVDHKYGQSGSPWEFNLRDILRWCELLEGSNGILPEKLLPEQFLDLVYLQRMRTPEDRLRILDLYCEIFGTLANIQTYPDVSISSEYLHVGPAILRRRAGTQVQRDSFKRVQLLPGFGNRLQAMMYCVEQGWMCILVGPSGSGKTSLVRSLAALSGNTLHEIAMSSATDTTELLGCFEQHDPFRHLQNIVKRVEYFLACTRDYCFSDRAVSTPIDRKVLKNLSSSWAAFQKVSKSWYESAGWAQQKDRQVLDPITIELLEQTVEHLQQAWEVYGMRETNVRAHPSSLSQDLKDVKETLDQGQNLGRFEWIDGDLLKAIESGDWMVLENANLCSPTVLDRLNPLLEPGGTILLNERGLVNGEIVTVRSHPNFRLFLTVDPSHGEVSRAMRNRGVEIFMMQPDWISPQIKEAESQQVHNDDKRQDAFSLVVGAGIPSDSLTGAIFSAYKDISNFLGSFRGGTQNFLRDLSLWISLLQQLLTRGADFRRSLERSWIQTFARRLENLEDRSEAVRILWSQISRQLLSSTQALQQTCLNVAGGWPRPQSLEMFCLKSVEACVERDAAYLEFLAAQQVASLVSRAWDSIPQTQSERLSLLQSERDGLVYFPVRLLQQYWNPRHKLGTEMLGVPKSDVKSPDGDALLLHACLWMLERGTFSDIILRIQWVERCARKAKNASYILKCLGSVLKSELQHELIMQLQAAWDQLEAASGGTTVAKLVPYLFPGVQLSYNLTIRLVNDGKVKDAWMKVAHLGRQVLALRQSLFQWQLEDEAYKSAATQVGSSPLMQSYLHHTNEAFRLNTFPTRVPKVILHYAYPFFTSVRRFEHEVLLLGSVDLWETGGAKAFTELQKSHGALWNVLQQRIFSEELFVFHWMHLKSSLLKIDKLFVDTSLHTSKVVSELQDILRALDKVFYFGSSLQVKPLLWKHGGHPRLFSSKDLNDKEMQIRSICENSWEDADQDEMIWSVAFDVELRRVILEGLSMSMYLRQNKLHGRSEKGSITSAASITAHEAELECGEVLQILLQKLDLTDRRLKEIREPDMSNMSLRLGSSEDKRTSLSTCSCVDKHPDEELLLRGVVHVPNLCEFQLELVTWLDYISFRQDNAFLAEISAAVSAYMSDEDASQAFKQQILDRKSISDVLEFSLTASSRSPTDLVPHQHVLWIVDSLSSKSPDIAFAPQDIAHEMWFGWHRAIWRRRPRHLESDHNSAMIEGPSQLFVPAETVMLSRLIGRGVALKEHCIRLRQLRVASKHLWNFQSKKYPNLTSLNLHSCSSLLMQMIVAHRKSFPQKVFLEIRDIFNALEHGITNVMIHGCSDNETMDRSLAELGTLLRSSQHAGLMALIDSHLMPCATLLYTTSWNKLSVSDTLLQLGHLWLLVGLIRVSLILPVDGCDPVERHGFKHNLLANELDSLKLELEVRRKCELSIGASCFTPVFSAMQVKIDELHQRLAASSVKIVPRPEHPKFREFYDAVEQFVNTSGSFERLKTLSCKLGKGHLNGESAAQEAVAWQGTSQNFIDRLASKFPAYRDFAQPVQQGIYEFKFGLSLGLTAFAQRTTLEAGGVSRDENGLSDLICIMMEYPTRPHVKLSTSYGWNGTRTSAATALVNGMTKDIVSWGASFLKSSTVAEEVLQMEMKLNVLQVALLKAGQEVMQSRIITKADLNLLNCVFSSFSTLWSTIRECQAKREREKNEVFKVSTSTFSLDTGPAPEDENLGTTTSDFGWLGVDLSEDGEEDQIQSAGTHKEPMKEDSVAMEKAWSRMRDTLVENVTRIHQYIFAASSLVEDDQQPIGNLTETERLHSFRLSYDTGTQLFQVLGHCLPAFLDEQLLPAHLMRVNLEHQILSGRLVAEGSAATVDIYADNQPAEVALMVDPVQDLSNRIVRLLVEWPEHPILQQLLKICKTLLSFPIDTSIIKALSGVELLLTKAQSWEDNAAKHVSVANELQNLSRLVTRWRKLELEVWLSLLEKTEKAYALSSQHMWFPLYDLLHRPCIVEIHEYLKDTSKSVEDFMHSATFGEYRTRLHILRAFSCQFSAQIRANAPFGSLSKELTEKVWTILYNVYKYYRQFLPVLDDVVVNEKRSLEAELKEHVRLSEWDDRSHYTMTRSSEKSRRTLQKLLKKYNDLLRRSMAHLLDNQTLQMGAHNLSVIACSAEGVDAANSLKAEPIALNESGCTGEPRATEREKFGCSTELWQDQCGTRLSKLRDLSIYFPDAYPVTKSFHERLHGLAGKMGPLLEAPVFSRASSVYRLNGVESLELLSTSIITRAMELKNNEKKIAVKKKAVTDLISALREIGLSPYNSAVPKGQRDRQSWLLLSPAEARCNEFPEVISMNWRKASDYYFKNMALIQHFERSRSNFNKDLSLREVDLFSKFAAHLLYIQQRQRKAAHDFSLNLFLLGELAQALQSCGNTLEEPISLKSYDLIPWLIFMLVRMGGDGKDDPSFPNQGFMKKWMWQQKHFFDLLQEVVAETIVLFKSSENIPVCPFSSMRIEAGAVRSILHDVSIGLDECKARLEYHLVPRGQAACLQKQYGSWPLLFTARMLKDLSTNFKFLTGAQATLKPIFGTSAVSISKKFHGLASLQQLLEKGYGMLEEFQLESHQCRQRGDSDPLNTSEPLSKLCDKVVSEVLLAVQRVNKAWVNIPKVQLDPSAVDGTMKEAFRLDGTLYSYERAIMDQIDSLRVSTICQAVLDVLALSRDMVGDFTSGGTSAVALGALLSCINAPLEMIHAAGVNLLFDFFSFHKSVTKLGYVLSNLFVSLVSEGFCTTETEGQHEESNTYKDASGTGMGEGQGKVDVSDQIDNEEQVMGGTEKTDDTPQQDGGQEKVDKGIEMEQEFAGDMRELSEDDQDEDDSVEDQENLDSKMGEANADDEVVDSKLWDNEENTDLESGSNEKYDRNSSVSGAKPEDIEMRGREGEREPLGDDDEQETERSKACPTDENPYQYESPTSKENEEDKDSLESSHDAGEQGRGVEQTIEESLDFPENLDLDGQGDSDTGLDEQGDSRHSGDDQESNESELPETMNVEEEAVGQPEESGAQEQMDLEPSENEGMNHDLDASPKETDDKNNESAPNEGVDGSSKQHDTLQSFNEGEAPVNADDGSDQTSRKFSEQASTASGMGHYSEPTYMQSEMPEKGLTEALRDENLLTGVEQKSVETENGASKTSLFEPSSSMKGSQTENLPDVNPYRSLGDAMKQWKEHLRLFDSGEAPVFTEKSEAPANEELPSDEGTRDYEFVQDNEQSTAQALGSATREQVDKNSGTGAQRTDQESIADDVRPEVNRMDPEDNKRNMVEELNIHGQQKHSRSGNAKPQTKEESTDHIVRDISSLTVDDTLSAMSPTGGSLVSLQNPKHETYLSSEPIGGDPESWSQEDIHHIRKELEANVVEMGDAEEARSIWQKYEHLTARLSQELAEQLRLILEPTLATKLQGDYRTGKRINMKKIIPYIASSFRKDKIWLRRTKPSKRQYQVVIAIDDSRSMSEAHCGHLAMEALFTICRAMSKLEIGQMAVTSFGRKGNVHLLHDFDQPFSSEAGINMIRQFSFSQDNTIADKPMVDLLQFLTRMLDMATRSSNSPSENVTLQQLVLIIADGRFHEKESLRRCIREASSRRQLLAFIVLDNPKASILDMQSVSFANGAPSFTKYLDSFPFPYYILLRDIEALPQTLADLIRQWFELAQNSST